MGNLLVPPSQIQSAVSTAKLVGFAVTLLLILSLPLPACPVLTHSDVGKVAVNLIAK